ncbi:MAG: flagellar hook-basal body complex protein [Pseudomonadota bacterium]
MDNPGYVTLSRQAGLLKQMQVIANNVANISTDGFRRESVVFSEIVDAMAVEGGSISQTDARVRQTDYSQAALRKTGGAFDFAIEGDGFFLIETPEGQALTRAGSFARNADGEAVTADGNRVLDSGGAPLFFPPDANKISVATDGTVSADGQAVGQLAIVTVDELSRLTRTASGLLTSDQALIPAEDATVFQGFVETSNVNPVLELTRMIQVQRSYELGQSFLEAEDERIRQFIRVTGTTS